MLADLLTRSARRTPEQAQAVEQALLDAYERGRLANPGVSLPADAFVRLLASRLGPDPTPETIAELRAEPLYLVGACLGGDPKALERFEARHLARVVGGWRMPPGHVADEIRQELRVRLLLGDPPKLATYGGRGDLDRWLRTVAERIRLEQVDRFAKEEPFEDALAERLFAPDDPAIRSLKQQYRPVVRRALLDALGALEPQLRVQVRQYYLDGMNVTELGTLYGVAPSTISRRLSKARHELGEATLRRLREELELSAPEAESLVRLVQSQLDLSRASILKSRAP